MELDTIQKMFADNIGCKLIVKTPSGNIEGLNLGLNFQKSKIKWGEIEVKGCSVYYEDKKKVYIEDFSKLEIVDGSQKVIGLDKVLKSFFNYFLYVSVKSDFKMSELEVINLINDYLGKKEINNVAVPPELLQTTT